MKSRVAFEPPQVGGPVGFMGDSVRHRLLLLPVGIDGSSMSVRNRMSKDNNMVYCSEVLDKLPHSSL